jgi:hypothetical protein
MYLYTKHESKIRKHDRNKTGNERKFRKNKRKSARKSEKMSIVETGKPKNIAIDFMDDVPGLSITVDDKPLLFLGEVRLEFDVSNILIYFEFFKEVESQNNDLEEVGFIVLDQRGGESKAPPHTLKGKLLSEEDYLEMNPPLRRRTYPKPKDEFIAKIEHSTRPDFSREEN